MSARTDGHRHEAEEELSPHGFDACVAGGNCNPASHGGVSAMQVCACGATRMVNANGARVEYGPWEVPS